jgi:hypothetical protein
MLMFPLQVTCYCFHLSAAQVGLGLLVVKVSRSHSDTRHSIGPLWTSGRPVADTSIWKHTALTRDRRPRPQLDSNPLSQQATADLRTRPHGHWDGLQVTDCSWCMCSDIRENVVCTAIGNKYWILISSLSRMFKAVRSLKCETVFLPPLLTVAKV